MASTASRLRGHLLAAIRRAFGEFLALPLAVLLLFVGLAVLLYWVDDVVWSQPVAPEARTVVERLLGDRAALSSLLATVATSMITVTSITFSLLLVAVQQGAAALTTQVFDQFLRRRWNQFYFGFFVGLSTFVLITLVTVSQVHRPIFAALVAVVLTACALCMMVVLIYNTIDQMRPAQIVRAIHGFAIRSRETQRELLSTTRRRPDEDLPVVGEVAADENGVVSRIGVAALQELAEREACPGLQVELLVAVGSSVAYGWPLARIRSRAVVSDETLETARATIRSAIRLDQGRDLACDPGYAVEQLLTMGWTSVSTAKSNPQPGILATRAFTDILSRWGETWWPLPEDPASAVVYPDCVLEEAILALESLAIVASESMQHQTLAEVMRALAFLVRVLPPPLAKQVEQVSLRSLSALGEHAPTQILDEAVQDLEEALAARGFAAAGTAVRDARQGLAASIGRLNSRSTRVPGA